MKNIKLYSKMELEYKTTKQLKHIEHVLKAYIRKNNNSDWAMTQLNLVKNVRLNKHSINAKLQSRVKLICNPSPIRIITSARIKDAKKQLEIVSSKFLESPEWRRLRMDAIEKYGNRCQCCGATPKDDIVINVDHIKPRRLFPELSLDITNLQILCNVCNHGKGNRYSTDWRNA